MATGLRTLRLHSLRVTTVGVLLLTFALLAVGQFFGVRHMFSASLEQSEQHDELLRARQVQALFIATRDEVERLSWDNATWDEARNFVLGQNPGFLDVNFSPDIFDVHNCDAMAVLRSDFSLVASRGFDHSNNTIAPVPEGFIEALAADGEMARHFAANHPTGGYVRIAGRNYVFGSSPVLHNGGLGEPVGWLVSLRRIDAGYLAYLADRVGSEVSVRVLDNERLRPVAASVPLSMRDLSLDSSHNDLLHSSFVLGALDPAHDLVISIATPRTLRAATMTAARSLLYSTLIAGLIASLFALWFIDASVLAPLQRISAGLRRIGEERRLSDRLTEPERGDEIGSLTQSVNGMLARIEVHERDTQRSRDAALTASRVKSEFVARMSHEIRTPMNGVLGMAELLGRTELNDRQRRFCETIHRSATSLLHIVNDILDFSKMEAGRMMLAPVAFSVRSCVEDVVELLAGRAHERDTELVVAIDPNVPAYVTADPLRLTQILTNLVGNAVKFTEHGEIVVAVRLVAQGESHGRLEFSVRDTGIGISPAARESIFESFTQAEQPQSGTPGTGLGLAIARQLVALMNGEIWVESSVGEGSNFRFTIEAELASTALPAAEALFTGRTILIAAGRDSANGALETTLRTLGAKTSPARDRAALATALAADAAELVILDSTLVDAALAARLRELRARSGAGRPRVIVLNPIQALVAAPGAPGADCVDAYLGKPVRQAQLTTSVARLLGVRGAAAGPDPLATGEYLAHRRLQGLSVLVVEDNPVNRDVAIGMLQALGCSAHSVCDGEEALALLSQQRFDVILMDRQMPRRDGIATTLELRRREAAAQLLPTPVIALTARAAPGAREACLSAGMNDFLQKPLTLSELSAVLARAMRRQSAAQRRPNRVASQA